MKYGFIKVACVSPRLRVADCEYNCENIINEAGALANAGVEIAVFPELSITGYSCGDLFFQDSLEKCAIKELEHIARALEKFNMLVFVGLPFVQPDGIFNVSAALYKGDVLALIPKANVPSYGAFNENRIFTGAGYKMETRFVSFGCFENVPFGTNIIINDSRDSNISIACEIGQDLWCAIPPSSYHTQAGANIIINPYAINEEAGRADYFSSLVKSHSGRTICGYVSSGAGKYESTQDMVFAGHNIISENGTVLADGCMLDNGGSYSGTLISDIDVQRIAQDRIKSGYCKNCDFNDSYISVEADFGFNNDFGLNRIVQPNPFVPADNSKAELRYREVADLQSWGLARRLEHINCKACVVGLSGGLDSTLALLITCRAFDILGISRKGITAVTMPCFGTTDRTYNNACQLARECNVLLKEIPIGESVRQHFRDIGHDESCHNVTYENSQARERTQVLMDYANSVNGIVIGTGDLSELALGWCTYNGDQMSMYGVNGSVPKTLVSHIVNWFAENSNSSVLKDILDTPISPELLPPDKDSISQVTEDLVGPYELHDFYLYYILRFGFSPAKIIYLAENSELKYKYNHETMVKWLRTFYRRFFTQQFKRSCMPDGAKAGCISLSPRGDWKMPSDACGTLWIKETEEL